MKAALSHVSLCSAAVDAGFGRVAQKKMKAADVRESVALFLRFLLLLPLHTYIFGYGFDKYLLFSNF